MRTPSREPTRRGRMRKAELSLIPSARRQRPLAELTRTTRPLEGGAMRLGYFKQRPRSISRLVIAFALVCILHYTIIAIVVSEKSIPESDVRGAVPIDVTLPLLRVLCIRGPLYGRTFNQLIQTACAVKVASEDKENGTTIVGLSPEFSEFYEVFLDPRADILLNYTGPCVSEYTPQEIFLIRPLLGMRDEFRSLVPKAIFRAEAEAVLASFPLPVTTVHRRNLEGTCHNVTYHTCINRYAYGQMNASEFVDACNMEYQMIAKATQGTSVVLLTDNQVPELDATFPYISDHSFPVQAWMMARSAVHYGNPRSTVDTVVYYWRDGRGDMLPRNCYKDPDA